MLNSNSDIKKFVASVLMCFAVLFSALNFGCCLRNSAVAVRDTILRDNEAESEDDFPFMHTYAYSDPPGENEQEQIFDDKSRKPETMPLNAAIFLEMVRHKNYLNGNCSPQ